MLKWCAYKTPSCKSGHICMYSLYVFPSSFHNFYQLISKINDELLNGVIMIVGAVMKGA